MSFPGHYINIRKWVPPSAIKTNCFLIKTNCTGSPLDVAVNLYLGGRVSIISLVLISGGSEGRDNVIRLRDDARGRNV